MTKMYRIYLQGDDTIGWHTAIYYDKDLALQYFNNVRKKYPNELVITEVLNEDTGEVISRKRFGYGATLEEVKACRQEYVSLIKYDVEFKDEVVWDEHISPEEAARQMIYAVGEPGYGSKWILIVRTEPLCSHF